MQGFEKKQPGPDQFTFQRMGGIDQVVLLNDYDWQNLDKLDPKLWMALSCPTAGLEFSPETLALLDADQDGRVRAQEVREAVQWVCQRLAKPSRLREGSDILTLADLRTDTPEGEEVASALKIALEQGGKGESDPLNVEEITETLKKASDYPFNGDGIITIDSAIYAEAQPKGAKGMEEYLRLGMSIIGAKKDAAGKPGLDEALAGQIAEMVEAALTWRGKLAALDLPLGEKTGEAWTLIELLRPKLEDYFNRCRLAAYAPDATALVDEGSTLKSLAEASGTSGPLKLDKAVLLNLPIAKINPAGTLDLSANLNPAWEADCKQFAEILAPLLTSKNSLSLADWENIKGKFGPYAANLEEKPVYPAAAPGSEELDVPGLPPLFAAPANDPLGRGWLPQDANLAIEALPDDKLKWLQKEKDAFAALVKQDLDAPSLASFKDLYKLSLYNKYLHTFLMNFLSFMDFYNPEKKAIFQTGTLYLNSLGCTLSVPVGDIDTHASLSVPSQLCLIYCECTRTEADGSVKNMTIASALTQGSLADLLDGRHGLFVDNAGKEWDTKIVRIIHNPVSIREAVWSPYRRLATMASQQIQKFVSKKQEDATAAVAAQAANVASGKAPEPKQGFDFARGAGIFAALGVALSAVSAAFAYIANSLASLGWLWPLALVLVFLCISGPSAFMAWLKLRKRNLGPLLDASGWAVNKGAPINLTIGAALTSVDKLPPNAFCDTHDPYSLPGQMLRRKWKTRFWLTVFILLAACVAGFWLYLTYMPEPQWLKDLAKLWQEISAAKPEG